MLRPQFSSVLFFPPLPGFQKKSNSSNNSWNLCSNCCLLFQKRACEGDCQGAPGKYHSVSGSTWAGTFHIPVFGIPFFAQNIRTETNASITAFLSETMWWVKFKQGPKQNCKRSTNENGKHKNGTACTKTTFLDKKWVVGPRHAFWIFLKKALLSDRPLFR